MYKINFETPIHVHFIGIGGISMSGLAEILLKEGFTISGSDNKESALTDHLEQMGAKVFYGQKASNIIPGIDVVVYTAAIHPDNEEYAEAVRQKLPMLTRAELLGQLMTNYDMPIAISGTHGKTTTSTMTAHLLHQSHVECTAFLGGISKNYGTNLLLSQASPYTVIEADEFDRSFHWLSPYMTVITSTDPDHLDIYGTEQAYLESFEHYTTLIQPGGALIIRKGISLQPKVQPGVRVYTYSRDEGDFHAENIRIGNGEIFIDFVAPDTRINDIQLGIPVSINIENGVAAMALAHLNGVTDEEIKRGMASFRGVDRRFDFKLKNDRIVFLSDYAHHPSEIKQSVLSMRELYKDKKITAIFQPHLYTRTRDFYQDFADSLSLLDEVILVDIYPAREAPIPGVTSKLIYDNLRPGIEKSMCKKDAFG